MRTECAGGAVASVITLLSLGGLLERKRSATWLEPLRVIGLIAAG